MSKIEVNQISSQCGSTLTIGQSGDTVTLASGATQSGFGRTGTVDWDTTAKTANFTAVSGDGYFVNTTSAAITVTLPAGSAGSIVSLKDYANTWQTNNVTVTPDGTDKINGTVGNATLNTQDQSVTLVYVDSTKGWRVVQDSTSDVSGAQYITATGGTITTCGDYKIHTFTAPGTFCVSSSGNPSGSTTVDYLVIAGGASGGSDRGGGGGAGGYRESSGAASGCYTVSPLGSGVSALPVSATGYPITVGAGGAAQPYVGGVPGLCNQGNAGSNSIFSTITSAGGGGGGSGNGTSAITPATVGASGGSGGGATNSPGGPTSAGSGNTPPVSPPQGNSGGNGSPPGQAANGGGGATTAGSGGSGANGRAGGTGGTSSINATPTARAGGGGGGNCNTAPGEGGAGGSGGGGKGGGGTSGGTPAVAGTTNTGGGGGGGGNTGAACGAVGFAGGSGIVIIRYKYQ